MMTREDATPRSSTVRRLLPLASAALLAALAFSAAPAHAALVLNIQSVSAAAGSSNDAFDVSLTNTGGVATEAIAGFGFTVQSATNNITFTNVTTATTVATYIFGANSLFGPNISTGTTTGPPTVSASDLFETIGSGTILGAGATVGLGHVLFNVAPGATPGPFTLSFTSGSLSDTTPSPIAVTTTNTGTLTITVAAVPEPSTWVAGTVVTAGLLVVRRRRRTARTQTVL